MTGMLLYALLALLLLFDAFVVTIMINLLEIVEHQEQEIARLTDESLHHIH